VPAGAAAGEFPVTVTKTLTRHLPSARAHFWLQQPVDLEDLVPAGNIAHEIVTPERHKIAKYVIIL
jgi:hypothetical protein